MTILEDLVSLAQIAPKAGSYATAYALATSGLFGDPVAVIGRSKLFSASAVDAALAKRAATRKAVKQKV